jgi:hypothetical protein
VKTLRQSPLFACRAFMPRPRRDKNRSSEGIFVIDSGECGPPEGERAEPKLEGARARESWGLRLPSLRLSTHIVPPADGCPHGRGGVLSGLGGTVARFQPRAARCGPKLSEQFDGARAGPAVSWPGSPGGNRPKRNFSAPERNMRARGKLGSG